MAEAGRVELPRRYSHSTVFKTGPITNWVVPPLSHQHWIPAFANQFDSQRVPRIMHKHHQTVEVFLALQPNVDETFVIINRNPGNAPLRFPGYGFPLHAATKGPALSYSRRNPIRPVSRVVSKDPFPFCCATIPFHRLVTCSISLQSQPQGSSLLRWWRLMYSSKC